MTRDEWYKWVRENPEKCTIDVLADALHPTGADMAIEDGEHHPDLARALKGRNPLDSRHNVVGELIQQLTDWRKKQQSANWRAARSQGGYD